MFLFFHFQSNNTNEDPVTPPRDNSIHDDNGCHSSTKRKSTGRTRRQSRRSMMKRRSSVALIDFSQHAEVSLSSSSSVSADKPLFTYLSLPCSILITVTTPKPHPQQYLTMALTSQPHLPLSPSSQSPQPPSSQDVPTADLLDFNNDHTVFKSPGKWFPNGMATPLKNGDPRWASVHCFASVTPSKRIRYCSNTHTHYSGTNLSLYYI